MSHPMQPAYCWYGMERLGPPSVGYSESTKTYGIKRSLETTAFVLSFMQE